MSKTEGQGKQRASDKAEIQAGLRSLTGQSAPQCNPYDRDWEGKQQKCERCNRLGLDCGPNIRKKDEDSNLPASSSSIQQSNSQSPREGFSVQNVQYTEPLRQSGEREEWLEGHEKRSPTATSEDFRSKSLSR